MDSFLERHGVWLVLLGGVMVCCVGVVVAETCSYFFVPPEGGMMARQTERDVSFCQPVAINIDKTEVPLLKGRDGGHPQFFCWYGQHAAKDAPEGKEEVVLCQTVPGTARRNATVVLKCVQQKGTRCRPGKPCQLIGTMADGSACFLKPPATEAK